MAVRVTFSTGELLTYGRRFCELFSGHLEYQEGMVTCTAQFRHMDHFMAQLGGFYDLRVAVGAQTLKWGDVSYRIDGNIITVTGTGGPSNA